MSVGLAHIVLIWVMFLLSLHAAMSPLPSARLEEPVVHGVELFAIPDPGCDAVGIRLVPESMLAWESNLPAVDLIVHGDSVPVPRPD